MAEDDRLEGHDEIRKYIDPKMSRSYYFKHIRPRIDPAIFTRTYIGRSKRCIMKHFSFKKLIQVYLLRTKRI